MAGNKLDKQIATALKSTERWLRKQPTWPDGHLRNASGTVVSHRGPSILSERDCVMQFARQLNDAGVPWKDLHMEVSPGQWLVNQKKAGLRPPSIDLVIANRESLGSRTEPFSPGKRKDFLFDAVFEFRLASNFWERTLRNGKPAKPPAKVRSGIGEDVKKVRKYLDTMLAQRGYVVVVEECDHGFDRGDGKAVDGMSVRYLKCY